MRRARVETRSARVGRRLRAGLPPLAMLVGVLSAAAVRAQETDWPCQQRLVPTLEAGQMWAGPPLDDMAVARMPVDVTELARALANVDLPPESMAAKVKDFAGTLAADQRGEALNQLFVAGLDDINVQRDGLIAGIRRYARRQQQLAERISTETRELEAAQRAAAGDQARIAELQASRDWDLRVHTDRQHALREVCDQPVRLEQRAFALARAIQEQLP